MYRTLFSNLHEKETKKTKKMKIQEKKYHEHERGKSKTPDSNECKALEGVKSKPRRERKEDHRRMNIQQKCHS